MTRVHYYRIIQSIFIALKMLCIQPIHPSVPPNWATTDPFILSIVFPVLECQIVGIIQYVSFSNWPLSVSTCIWCSSISFHCLTMFIMWKCQIIFQNGCIIFAFSPTRESFYCSTLSLAFGIVSVPDFSYSNRSMLISFCFNLHFIDDIWYGTYFHISVCHLCIFFGEVSVKVFSPFFNWVFIYYHWALRVLCIVFDNSSFQMWLLQIFSPSLWLAF